jgi:hypothetical protein
VILDFKKLVKIIVFYFFFGIFDLLLNNKLIYLFKKIHYYNKL